MDRDVHPTRLALGVGDPVLNHPVQVADVVLGDSEDPGHLRAEERLGDFPISQGLPPPARQDVAAKREAQRAIPNADEILQDLPGMGRESQHAEGTAFPLEALQGLEAGLPVQVPSTLAVRTDRVVDLADPSQARQQFVRESSSQVLGHGGVVGEAQVVGHLA